MSVFIFIFVVIVGFVLFVVAAPAVCALAAAWLEFRINPPKFLLECVHCHTSWDSAEITRCEKCDCYPRIAGDMFGPFEERENK